MGEEQDGAHFTLWELARADGEEPSLGELWAGRRGLGDPVTHARDLRLDPEGPVRHG